MKFSKYNNPRRKTHRKPNTSPYSRQYVEEQKSELYALLAQAKTEEERDAIIKAYDVTIHPYNKGGNRNAY